MKRREKLYEYRDYRVEICNLIFRKPGDKREIGNPYDYFNKLANGTRKISNQEQDAIFDFLKREANYKGTKEELFELTDVISVKDSNSDDPSRFKYKYELVNISIRVALLRNYELDNRTKEDLFAAVKDNKNVTITRQTLRNYERGLTQPNPSQIKQLSYLLDVSESFLLYGGSNQIPIYKKYEVLADYDDDLLETKHQYQVVHLNNFIKMLNSNYEYTTENRSEIYEIIESSYFDLIDKLEKGGYIKKRNDSVFVYLEKLREAADELFKEYEPFRDKVQEWYLSKLDSLDDNYNEDCDRRVNGYYGEDASFF